MKWLRRGLLMLGVLLVGPLLAVSCKEVNIGQDWRTADRSSAGLAPRPGSASEAVVQVYAARAFNWRGIFAVHTWIATKEKDALQYLLDARTRLENAANNGGNGGFAAFQSASRRLRLRYQVRR